MDIISKILLGGKAYIKYIGRKDGDKMLFSELKCKDVINLRDCKKLGRVSDLEFDECSGKLCKIIVPSGNKFCNLFNTEPDYCIPYKDIRQIGPDIIIVDICI